MKKQQFRVHATDGTVSVLTAKDLQDSALMFIGLSILNGTNLKISKIDNLTEGKSYEVRAMTIQFEEQGSRRYSDVGYHNTLRG